METRAKYTLVGSIVSALIALTVIVLLWFARGGKGDASRPYLVIFHKQSVAGLQKDGSVTMRGINVGRVSSLRIANSDIELVKVEVAIDSGTPIKTDTEAIIRRNILTGLATIELVNSTQNSANLEPKEGEELAVIPEGKSELEQIASNLPKLLDEASLVLTRANAFLSPQNQESVTKTLANIETITSKFASDSSNVPELIESAADLSRSINGLVEDFRTGSNAVLRELAAALEIVSLELRGIGRELGHTSEAVTTTAERFQDPKTLIGGPARNTLGPGEEPK